jgi:tetratricopeptide (TPR) repeat protein
VRLERIEVTNLKRGICRCSPWWVVLLWLAIGTLRPFAASSNTTAGGEAKTNQLDQVAPVTPRDFYNAGARQLARGQLREAEAAFETALASQTDRLRVSSLYNLGHVRYQQGIAELKKSAQGGPVKPRGESASSQGTDAIKTADEALASNEVRQMVEAYIRGRGTRRELNAAIKAVRKAMQLHGSALQRWERSAADFKGALELSPDDQDAEHNADVVDRSIAKLIDSIKEMEQMANRLGQQKQELGEKLKQLKGRIPEPDMPPGAPGEEEEEEDEQPQGPKPDQQEGPTKEGNEQPISPEQASWMLDAYKLGGDRRLPMGFDTNAEPKNRVRPNW